MNNSSNNELNIELFNKVFKNTYIKTLIFSFLKQRKVGYSYKGLSSMRKLLDQGLYSVVLDKLQSQKFIYICKESLYLLFNSCDLNPYFEDTLELLLKQYGERVIIFNPLQIIMFINKKSSLSLFKIMYSYMIQYYCKLNSNSSSSITLSNPIYILYDLIDTILSSGCFPNNNICILEYILELINSFNNNNNNNNNNSSSDNISNYIDINVINKNKLHLLKSIYSNAKIPIWINSNFESLMLNINQKLNIIRDQFKLDLVSILKQYNSEDYIKEFDKMDINNQDSMEALCLIALYGNFEISSFIRCYFFNSFNYLKLFVLKKFKEHQPTSYQDFKLYLIENLNKIKDIESLIQMVQSYKKLDGTLTTNEDLLYYFDVYLIYHYIKTNNFNAIDCYLNEFKFNIMNSYSSSNFAKIKRRILQLLQEYSFSTFSIDLLLLYLRYKNKDEILLSSSFVFINDKDIQQVKFERLPIFLDTLKLNGGGELLSDIYVVLLLSKFHSGFVLEYLISNDQSFKDTYYKELKQNNIGGCLFETLGTQLGNVDFKKLDLYFEQLLPIDEHFKNEIFISNSKYPTFINYLLKSNHPDSKLWANQLLNKVKSLDVDDTIYCFKNLNQDILQTNIGNGESNRANILIDNLFKSIVSKDYISVNKIVSVLNNDNEIKDNCISFPSSSGSSFNKVIKYLAINGHLKQFDSKLMVKWVKNHFSSTISKEFMYYLILPNDYQLKEHLDEYYYKLIPISTHFDQDSVPIKIVDLNSYRKAFSSKDFQAIYDFIQTNGLSIIESDERYELSRFTYFGDIGFSIEWFEKLYDPLFKRLFQNKKNLFNYVFENGFYYDFQLFESIWSKLDNDQIKSELIEHMFTYKNQKFANDTSLLVNPLVEYVAFTRPDSIKSLITDNSTIESIHRFALTQCSIKLFKQIRSIFSSHQFKIDASIIDLIFNKPINSSWTFNIIVFLFESNLLPNLKHLIESNDTLKAKFYSCIDPRISKSNLILVHSIIKLQQQQ